MSITDKVIVLDLDETLVCVTEEMGVYKELGIDQIPNLRKNCFVMDLDDPVDFRGTGKHNSFWGIRRPHLREFLIFCFSYFKAVIVWSAGADRYVEAIVKEIFSGIADPHLVYARSKCVTDARARNHKPLSKMIRDEPGLSQYMSLSNTFAIDDKTSTYIDNPENGIQIPVYEPAFRISSLSSDDIGLLQLKDWLLRPDISGSTDVRTLDKSRIFEQPLSSPSFGACYISPETGTMICSSESKDEKTDDNLEMLRSALKSLEVGA